MSQQQKHTSPAHQHTAGPKQDGSGPLTAKRIIAWIAIILLVGMYIVTFIAAIVDSSATHQLFRFCLGMTIAVPIFAWILIYAIGWFTKKHSIASLDLLSSNKEARKEMEDGIRRETDKAGSSDTPAEH